MFIEKIERDLPKYVYRKGRGSYLYFVTRGGVCERLPDDVDCDEFAARYAELVALHIKPKSPKLDRRRKPREMPQRKDLHRVFGYDAESGRLFWHNDRSPADFVANDGRYFRTRFWGREWMAHRIIWKMLTGQEPDEIDHIDGNGLNNRFANLRSVTPAENARNMRLPRPKHGKHGVTPHGGRWKAVAGAHYLGLFRTYEEAVAAREAAERALGFHENHGREA